MEKVQGSRFKVQGSRIRVAKNIYNSNKSTRY
jgi:hypothetical protein